MVSRNLKTVLPSSDLPMFTESQRGGGGNPGQHIYFFVSHNIVWLLFPENTDGYLQKGSTSPTGNSFLAAVLADFTQSVSERRASGVPQKGDDSQEKHES